ncbi:phosphatases II [Tricholoma matsutake]|nr:phosphatases II [Tricholoma matsutake 945]
MSLYPIPLQILLPSSFLISTLDPELLLHLHSFPTTASLMFSVTSSSIEAVSEKADAFIDAAKSGKILVHCSAAVSRSPTIVTAYLMKKHGMTLKEALGLIVRARPPACPNAGFLAQLKELEFKLYGVSSLDVDLLPAKREDRLALFHV